MWERSLCTLLLLLGCGCSDDCEAAVEILGTCFQRFVSPNVVEVALDVDADGSEELISWDSAAGTLQVIGLGSNGELTITSASSTELFGWAATGDVDGDGVREILNGHGRIETFRVAVDGTLTLIGSEPGGPVFGLVEDEEGIAHLIIATPYFSFHTFVDGDWDPFAFPSIPAPGGGVGENGAQGDFDGNGRIDVAFWGWVPDGPSPLSILRAKDGTIVESASEAEAGPSGLRASVGDLDGDGTDDLLLWNDEARVSILWGDADAPLVAHQLVELPAGARGGGLADFEGDGSDEILYSTSVGADPVLHRLRDPSNGASGQALVTLYTDGLFFDLDGDGIDDLFSDTWHGTHLFVSMKQ
jgi:hypothetical protein